MEQKRNLRAKRVKEEAGKGGRWSLGRGDVGLSFSSSVWILVLLLGTGAPLAFPGLRNLNTETRLVADISTALSYTACMRLVPRAGTAPAGVLGSLDAYLPPWGVPGRQWWELRSHIQTTQRGSAPGRGGRSRAWCGRAYSGADRDGTEGTACSVQRKSSDQTWNTQIKTQEMTMAKEKGDLVLGKTWLLDHINLFTSRAKLKISTAKLRGEWSRQPEGLRKSYLARWWSQQ